MADELEPRSVDLMDDLFVDDSKSETPFAAEPFVAKSEPPLADDKFMTKTFNAVVVTAKTLESEEFVITVVIAIAELVVTSRPKFVEFNVLALGAFSPVVVDSSNSVVFVLGEVEERLAVPLEELEEL